MKANVVISMPGTCLVRRWLDVTGIPTAGDRPLTPQETQALVPSQGPERLLSESPMPLERARPDDFSGSWQGAGPTHKWDTCAIA